MKSLSLVALASMTFLGCETIFDRAERAQARVAAYTNDVAVVTNVALKVKFSGRGGLREFAEFAVSNRPDVVSARLAISNAVLTLAKITSDRRLQATLSGGYSQSSLNSGSHFSWRQHRGRASADISFDLLLYDWGRLDAREQAAREDLISAIHDHSSSVLDVLNEVSQAYFALRRSDALLAVARTNEFMHAEHLKQSESLFKAGEAKKLDVLKARVDLSDARLETINASNNVVTAGAEFLRSLGLQSDRATRGDVLAVSANCLEPAGNVLPRTTYSAVEALQIARTNSPSLMALRARLRAASADVDLAVAELFPELSASAAFNFVDPTWNWTWGVRASQYLLDGRRRELAVEQAIVAMDRARTAVEQAEQRLSYDLAVAAANRDNARQSLDAATIEVEQAKENFENVMMQYRVGDASRLDFTDAAGTLASALGARVKAFYSAEAAEAELMRLTGMAEIPEKPGK